MTAKSAGAAELVRKAVSAREAARMYGVSVDTIRDAKRAGALRAKAVSFRSDGQPTKELYRLEDLEAWFESLSDA